MIHRKILIPILVLMSFACRSQNLQTYDFEDFYKKNLHVLENTQRISDTTIVHCPLSVRNKGCRKTLSKDTNTVSGDYYLSALLFFQDEDYHISLELEIDLQEKLIGGTEYSITFFSRPLFDTSTVKCELYLALDSTAKRNGGLRFCKIEAKQHYDSFGWEKRIFSYTATGSEESLWISVCDEENGLSNNRNFKKLGKYYKKYHKKNKYKYLEGIVENSPFKEWIVYKGKEEYFVETRVGYAIDFLTIENYEID